MVNSSMEGRADDTANLYPIQNEKANNRLEVFESHVPPALRRKEMSQDLPFLLMLHPHSPHHGHSVKELAKLGSS